MKNKVAILFKSLFTLVTVFSVSCLTYAGDYQVEATSLEDYNTLQSTFNASDYETSYIPNNLKKEDDPDSTAKKIINHNLKKAINKSASMAKSIKRINAGLSSSITIDPSKKNETSHNIGFQMRALETKASLKYAGIVNAVLSYKIDNHNVDMNISKKLSESTKIVIRVNQDTDETKQILGLNYNW
ncbi:MAG: hypothetical protein HOO06_16785 [Bdellovibrionaceae bacterium]|jgi:hypothetical protein|nr:hypothetical protein [Pseudobdellovibrionaceae bacterium]